MNSNAGEIQYSGDIKAVSLSKSWEIDLNEEARDETRLNTGPQKTLHWVVLHQIQLSLFRRAKTVEDILFVKYLKRAHY